MSDTVCPPTVLLVDDDKTVRFLLRLHLTRLCPLVQVLEAPDGEQGLAQVAAHCQATTAARSLLVLLDLHMPVLGGLGFLERYRGLPAAYHQATTVIVSSTSQDAHELACAQAVATAVVPKPLRQEVLAQLVHQHLPTAFSSLPTT